MAEVRLKPLTAGWMLVVIYGTGIIGLSIPQTRQFIQVLLPYGLLFTFITLFCYHKKWTREFVLSALMAGSIGYLLEVLGVKTGYLFGYYQFGPALGFSLWDTPLILAAWWLSIIYITRQVAEMIAKDAFLTSLLSAFLIVLLDYFIEPFASRYGLWKWNSGQVPMHNYIGRFIGAVIIQYLFQKAVKYPPNKLSLPIYLIQLGFFMVLYLL
jgi:uncharacterized membrane protein